MTDTRPLQASDLRPTPNGSLAHRAQDSPRGVNVPRLAEAIRSSTKALAFYRSERAKAVEQYAGMHWGPGGAQEEVYVNLLDLFVRVVGRSLVGKNPRFMLSTFSKPDKPAVAAVEAWVNREVETTYLAETFRRVVLDALFSVGIMKVGLSTPADSALHGYSRAAGVPYACRVDLDDFAFDHRARCFEEAGFLAHKTRVPLEVVRDSPLYGPGRLQLTPSTDSRYDSDGEERVSHKGREEGYDEEFEDFVDLWEVYVPRRRQVLTLAADDDGAPFADREPLRVVEWLGPDCGPFHFLCYGLVPDNAMPKSPIMDLIAIMKSLNRAYRKLIRQLDRQKDLTFVRGRADSDGNRVIQASDGEVIRVDDPEGIQQVSMGGANQGGLAMAIHLKQTFDFMAGNLSVLGGRNVAAPTATQERLLAQNSSAGVADLQQTTTEFVSQVGRALGWYWWHDPFKTMKVNHSLPGLPDVGLERRVTPQIRQRSRWADLEMKVDPYSMGYASPSDRLAGLNQLVTTVIIPLMPLLQQQGVAFDVQKYLERVAHYADEPDLPEIVTIQEAPEDQPQQQGGNRQAPQPGPAPAQQRTYLHQSVPTRTPQGDATNMVNSLMGVNTGGNPNGNRQPGGY